VKKNILELGYKFRKFNEKLIARVVLPCPVGPARTDIAPPGSFMSMFSIWIPILAPQEMVLNSSIIIFSDNGSNK
jgi:hypothetical protein